MNDKTEEILTSLEGITRAPAPPFLLTRIMSKLDPALKLAAPALVRWVLAGSLFLIAANVVMVISHRKQASSAGIESEAHTYQLY